MAFLTALPLNRPLPASGVSTRRPRPAVLATAPPQKRPDTKQPTLAEEYLQALGVSREHSRRAVSRTPRLATLSNPAKTAAPLLQYLQRLGLSQRQIARALQHAPHIIFKRRDLFAERVKFLRDVAGVPEDSLPSVVARCPHTLWMDVRSAAVVVETVVEACPHLPASSLGTVFARVPNALVTSPERVSDNIELLRDAGVTDAGSMGRIFAKAPMALVYDVRSLQKRIKFLEDVLGLPPETVGRVLVTTPELLEWSVEKKLQPRVALLRSLVGDNAVAGVVDKVPCLFGADDILDRVLWLRDEVGLNDSQMRHVLREAPAVLTYSIDANLAPKWRFIRDTMGGTAADIAEVPREALCANLQQRAMPRYAFLASSGVTGVRVVDVLRGCDVEFCKNVAKCRPESFRRFADNDTYLLFFSTLM